MRAAHDPPKCEWFGDEIMLFSKKNERDRTQNRLPLLLIALAHAPLPQGMWAVTGSKVNPRLAHLFMICSNIKLR
jgi:hypothetical protein